MNFFKDMWTRRILFIITFTVILTVFAFNYKTVLDVLSYIFAIAYPFIMGGIIAFILNVVLRLLENRVFKNVSFTFRGRSFKRGICLVLTIIIMIGVLFTVSFLLIPALIEAVMAIVQQLNIFVPQAQSYIENLLAENKELIKFLGTIHFDYQGILKNMTDMIGKGATDLVGNVFGIASSIAGTLLTFMISFIFAMYLLIQKEKLSRQLRLVMKAFFSDEICRKIEHVLELSFDTFSSFVTGQGLEAIVLGSIVGGSCWLFGLSYASVVGVIAAFCSFIPMFGSMIALVIGTLIQLIVSPYQAIFFLVMMFIIQQLDGNLIYPNIMGNKIGLPAMYVLIAFSVGGSLFGLFGMLLFIPITSILYDLFTEWVYDRIEKKKQLEIKKAS